MYSTLGAYVSEDTLWKTKHRLTWEATEVREDLLQEISG
jgi:hypothetical protein